MTSLEEAERIWKYQIESDWIAARFDGKGFSDLTSKFIRSRLVSVGAHNWQEKGL